ncbi:hypothetical protein [Salinibacterium sp. M195]|uniref:hypothetical protein n=1 Tax=Salinibacterium sp. M195 TaxID=2583374 RepID=UPI001C63B2D0|nr:hypothetical protein [Salinibacterium sp. M195]QYH35390.1 hypothetical protein FFT87_05145 [Salinibacterium sp. M195]
MPAGPPQGLAIAAMVTGIVAVLLAFMSLGFLPGVAAIILGHVAQKKQNYARPFWITGLITGYVATAISLIWGLVFLAALMIPLMIAGTGAYTYGY